MEKVSCLHKFICPSLSRDTVTAAVSLSSHDVEHVSNQVSANGLMALEPALYSLSVGKSANQS